MKIKEMRTEIDGLMNAVQAIKDKAVAEKRELNSDELDNISDKMDRAEALERAIEVEERTANFQSRMENPTSKPTKPAPKTRASVEGKGEWRSFGEWACAVRDANVPGGTVDERLFEERAAGSPTGSVASPSDGGFVVPKMFRKEVMTVFGDYANLAGRVRKIAMGDAMYVSYNYADGFDASGGTVLGGVKWANASEMGGYTSTKPEYGEFELKLKELYGYSYQSNKLLKFAPGVVEGLLRTGIEEGLRMKTDYELINGTGAAGPQGVLNAGCKVEVSKESGQASSTIVTENILKMYARGINRSNMIWLASPDTIPQLYALNLAVGTGGSAMFIAEGGLPNAPSGTLLGRPIIFTDACQTLGTAGDLIFFDPGMYHMGMSGTEADMSIHLKFDYAQTAFRWVLYWDGAVWMKEAFTPRNGGDSRSPVVTLADR